MAFPSSLPSYTGFTSTETLATAMHGEQHNQEQADIVAIATKMGTGSATPTSGTVLVGNGSGTSTWGQVSLTTSVSGVLPTSNGGTGTTVTTGSGANVFNTNPTLNQPNTVQLNNIGGMTNTGGLTTDSLTTSSITSTVSKLPISSNILANTNNPVWQYLGMAQITGNVGIAQTLATYITGLGVTVTIPTGATAVRITVYSYNISASGSGISANFGIYSGASVGSLTTQVGANQVGIESGYQGDHLNMQTVILNPTPGTISYSASEFSASATITINASSSIPAYILVESC